MVSEDTMHRVTNLLGLVLLLALGAQVRAAASTTVNVLIFSGRQISACRVESQSPLKLEAPDAPDRDLPAGVTISLKVEAGEVRVARLGRGDGRIGRGVDRQRGHAAEDHARRRQSAKLSRHVDGKP